MLPRPALPLLLLLPLTACTVVDAPETIEELVVFGFEHFDDGEDYLAAMGENLFPLIDEEILEGLEDGYHVDNLSNDHLAAAGVEEPDTVSIIGALGAVHYTRSLDPVLCSIVWPDKATAFEGYYLEYEVLDEDDRECFLARECDSYTLRYHQVIEVPFLGQSTQTASRGLRWIHPEDGEPYVVARGLSPDPVEFTTEIMEVDQQYDLVVLVPLDDGTVRRIETFWVEARFLGTDVPEYFAVETAVNSMGTQAERIDEFIDEDGGC